MRFAALLLVVGFLRHNGRLLVPPEIAGVVSKGLGGVTILCLLAVLWIKTRPPTLVTLIMIWWAWEETQVAVCSAMYAVAPWPVAPGQPICSAWVGFDLGSIGAIIVSILALAIAMFDSTKCTKSRQK